MSAISILHSDQAERLAQLEELVNHLRRQNELLTRDPSAMKLAARQIERDRLARVLACVCDVWRVTREEVLGRFKPQPVADARHCAIYLLHESGISHGQIGRWFGRDRSTATAAVRAYRDKLTDPGFAQRVERARLAMGEQPGPVVVCVGPDCQPD